MVMFVVVAVVTLGLMTTVILKAKVMIILGVKEITTTIVIKIIEIPTLQRITNKSNKSEGARNTTFAIPGNTVTMA